MVDNGWDSHRPFGAGPSATAYPMVADASQVRERDTLVGIRFWNEQKRGDEETRNISINSSWNKTKIYILTVVGRPLKLK